jgi:hypothetical protein
MSVIAKFPSLWNSVLRIGLLGSFSGVEIGFKVTLTSGVFGLGQGGRSCGLFKMPML